MHDNQIHLIGNNQLCICFMFLYFIFMFLNCQALQRKHCPGFIFHSLCTSQGQNSHLASAVNCWLIFPLLVSGVMQISMF